MKCSSRIAICYLAVAIACTVAFPIRAQEVSAPAVHGVVHFRRIGTTIACGGATTPAAITEIKKMGFVSDINFRLASEPGADVEAEAAAAKAADLRYYHIPFDEHHPSDAAVTRFLNVITASGIQPAYIHCSGGNRASTMWFIKLMVVDHWSVDRAYKEATALGMKNPAMKAFGIEYARTHKRPAGASGAVE
ncbi:MAG TPA: sulfur transferase domain-containing protein [Candidatus Dormibacteraeota bacterium]|nr:sulfur transferase domain-containing protein [Candidatus Dormibacteraeota bacterium]